MPTVVFHTLGCRLNQAETAIIANDLIKHGFELVDDNTPADLTVIHTCTVTEQADAKCRQAVRQSIRKNPDAFVAVIGCYAQMAIDTIRQIEGVDLIVGNEHKMQLSQYLDSLNKKEEPQIVHSRKISRQEFTIESIADDISHTRANLKIQDGCNFVCSFCIIASARGPARSRKFDDIIREANKLVDMGYKEIVLTGVNIGTYQQNGHNFLDVLTELDKVKGISRIRISSIEPTTVTKEIIDFIADSDTLCRHLHIPLQSGDDRILESMRRKHSAAFFEEIIQYAADKIPGIGLGTDIMVGYPTEGIEEFKNTKKLLADLPVSYFHVFAYSDRKGTGSYNLKPKVDYHIKKDRSGIMIEMGERKKQTFYDSFIGCNVNVLFEENYNGWWEGFSDNYMRVAVKSESSLKNEIRQVRLREVNNQKILGDIV
ncbi:MAG: tRNA (N(6)-L-threonylcarbamoyladenosine(37)-C(2))-methylthiotransferase MtaB [Calditrichaceae bacterium]|nr:tRNA (N(6)-L-threonylcarbamoyladenosine(37)-C(2))-methylthiotransferase MtaB [Calditrichaceae bacterium]